MPSFQRNHVAPVDLPTIGLLDGPAERVFDQVTQAICLAMDVPVSLLSIIDPDRERQFFKSATGLCEPWASKRETPLSHSFCQYVVTTGNPLIVIDARENELVSCNAAIRDLSVIAYAGVPVSGPDEQPIGALCAIASEPRPWTAPEIAVLSCLGDGLSSEIRLRAAMLAGAELVDRALPLAS
ncbi:MAG: GAF domain-containing protein [Pseudomonadota bacterium]